MKNGYTPRQYAHAMAIDALNNAWQNKFGELDGLTPSEERETKIHLKLLMFVLADEAKLDVSSI
jgi:hypothetical protein